MAQEQLPRVVLGEPRILLHAPGLNVRPQMLQLANGDVIVPADRYVGEERVESLAMISSDGGETWRRAASPWTGNVAGQLSDRTIITMAGFAQGPPNQPMTYVHRARRGKDAWESLQAGTVTIRAPAVSGIGDDLRPYQGLDLWNRLVELPNGDVLTTAYGWFEEDRAPIEHTYYRREPWPYPGWHKMRSVLLRSTDRGATWDYVSTIASDPASGDEGPCEPTLTRTRGGDLVCIMRTGRVTALKIGNGLLRASATGDPLR